MKSAQLQIERHEVRVFDAIVNFGGFSRAAERLNISQSAISQTMANLEHKLGTQLLIRGRTPELTESGRRMYSYVRLVLNEEQQALSDIELIRTGALSTLSLAINSMVNRFFSNTLLLRFCDQNPLTRLKLDVIPSKEIIYGVDEGRWELGFGPFQTEMPGHFETRAFFTENRVLAVHQNHPQFDQLMSSPQTALTETTLLTSYLDEATKRPEQGRLRSQFSAVWEISNLDLRLALAAAGKGVTYLSDRLLSDAKEMIAIPGLASASIPRQVGIYYKKHEPLSTGAKRFLALCDRHFSPPA
ncbi:MAG: LysR family transcriptional regulator [Gammaproteobacteria bacterium]|nr:LysR family transcriptional regulator [Gammaproteobacteria bacterium]